MNNDSHLLNEAYVRTNAARLVPVSPERYKFIVFPEEMEAYLVNPYKKVDVRYALAGKATGTPVTNWLPVKVVNGDDLIDIYPTLEKRIDPDAWYIATPNIPEESTFNALIGAY
jgi:hypothetical protein